MWNVYGKKTLCQPKLQFDALSALCWLCKFSVLFSLKFLKVGLLTATSIGSKKGLRKPQLVHKANHGHSKRKNIFTFSLFCHSVLLICKLSSVQGKSVFRGNVFISLWQLNTYSVYLLRRTNYVLISCHNPTLCQHSKCCFLCITWQQEPGRFPSFCHLVYLLFSYPSISFSVKILISLCIKWSACISSMLDIFKSNSSYEERKKNYLSFK